MTNEGVEVKLSDSLFIWSTHTALLDIPHLPIEARRAYLFLVITHALISISMLCEQGYMAIFDAEMVYIVKHRIVIMHSYRHPVTKLYIVNLNQSQTDSQLELDIEHMTSLGAVGEVANNAYEIRSKQKLVEYYHKCCFSPVVFTWIEAICKGNFCTFPGLTVKLVSKYLGTSIPTAKGHMQQQHKNVRLTQIWENSRNCRRKNTRVLLRNCAYCHNGKSILRPDETVSSYLKQRQ